MGKRDRDDDAPVRRVADTDPAVKLAAAKLGVSLLLALAVVLPTLSTVVSGDMTLDRFALRFVIAFALARIGVGLVMAMHALYRPAPPDDPDDHIGQHTNQHTNEADGSFPGRMTERG